MTSRTAPRRAGVTQLLASLAGTVDVSEAELLGRSVALGLRYVEDGDDVFLSGVAADLIDLLNRTFPTTAAASTVQLADAAWTPAGRAARVGSGPVAGTEQGAWTPDAARSVELRARRPDRSDKREEIAALRANLRAASGRLEEDLQVPPRWDRLAQLAAANAEAVRGVLDEIAVTRHVVGRYLLDAGDWFDDERIDQLGDGYVRLAQVWSDAAARGADGALAAQGREIEALEATCVAWMRGAADPPTRYAF